MDLADEVPQKLAALKRRGVMITIYDNPVPPVAVLQHLIATKALRCAATAWMLTVAESFAKF